MQRIVRNGELFHGEQKANSHNSGKNDLKTIVVLLLFITQCVSQTFRYHFKRGYSYSGSFWQTALLWCALFPAISRSIFCNCTN